MSSLLQMVHGDNMKRQYCDRDIEQLDEDGNYYCTHVMAMTAEGLHEKSDIAAELAWRDREIADFLEALQKIARSSSSEGGCYYTNKANIQIAKDVLKRSIR